MANTVKLDSVCPAVYGISVRRYQQLAKDGLVPASVDGIIDFVTSTKALIAYYQKLAAGQGSITLIEERARLTKMQADMATLDYAKRLGNLLEKDEVVRAWAGMVAACRARLLSIPVKVTPALDGLERMERKTKIEEAIFEALSELGTMTSEEIKQAAVKPEHAEAIKEPEAAKVKRKGKIKKGGKWKKLCALCGKKEIDRRSKFCRRCAALKREKGNKKGGGNDGKR
jgi:phage terminase Nu1 subunit (DNA packaging protein)